MARVRDRSISAASDCRAETRDLSDVRRHHRNSSDHLLAVSPVAVRAERAGEDDQSDIGHFGSATERRGISRGDALGAGNDRRHRFGVGADRAAAHGVTKLSAVIPGGRTSDAQSRIGESRPINFQSMMA